MLELILFPLGNLFGLIIFVTSVMLFGSIIGAPIFWLVTKLWRFKDGTFNNSLKTALVVAGTAGVTYTIFSRSSFETLSWAQSPLSFVTQYSWILLGVVASFIAMKKFFQESPAKIIGAIITLFAFAWILLFTIINLLTFLFVATQGNWDNII